MRGSIEKPDRMLHDPEIKKSQMKPIREDARQSLLADLRVKEEIEAYELNCNRQGLTGDLSFTIISERKVTTFFFGGYYGKRHKRENTGSCAGDVFAERLCRDKHP